MISFFLSFYRFIKILTKRIKEHKASRVLFVFILILLAGANLFYSQRALKYH